ncbi:hypothetical protein BCR42DRAFT_426378 [Absidia repens]|uniref:Uncharacterized protein n=1 Tax=Absidia repens TaxID=90262 RepID=A0A1X2I1D3_9FUNG|nr:hypothetical protein BCR42DRAFT_426378 [Absidia repens]
MSEYRVGDCILDNPPMISTALVSCRESGYFCYCRDYGWTIIVVIVVLVLSFLVCFLRYRKMRKQAAANAHHQIPNQPV